MVEDTLFTAVKDIGLAAVVVLLSLWGLWKILIPGAIKQYQTQVDYYINEIKALREEARDDKKLMFEAFNRNTEANTKLQGTLDRVNDQLEELSNKVAALNNDVTKVYLILGTEKHLIEKRNAQQNAGD